MFGHTFLNINSSYNSKLLSHAINYSANVDKDTENGFLFAIKGLFGGYYGEYSLLPYYDKLKEYRDSEQRDIWEYSLNLTKNEVINMVNHIWELKSTYSNYYFFDENCSYNILWLLEIARPTLSLREKFFYHVSPPDTIFEIVDAGLVESRSYRPSKRKVLLEYEKYLNSNDVELVQKLASMKTDINSLLGKNRLSKRKKQIVLESATELSEYNYIQGKISKELYLSISYNLSQSRSHLGQGKKLKIEKPTNPDQAHRQFSLSLGYRNQKDDLITFGLRPVYHDITNNDKGFIPGTQIEFLTPQFLYNQRTNSLKLDYLKLLTITSLAPKTKFFSPLSWRTSWKLDRESLDNNLNFSGKISAGKSYYIGKTNFMYALADIYLYNTSYSNSAIGGTIGAILYTSDSTKLNIESDYKIFDNKDHQKILDITQSFFIKNNIDVKFNYKYIEKNEEDQNSFNFSVHYFF